MIYYGLFILIWLVIVVLAGYGLYKWQILSNLPKYKWTVVIIVAERHGCPIKAVWQYVHQLGFGAMNWPCAFEILIEDPLYISHVQWISKSIPSSSSFFSISSVNNIEKKDEWAFEEFKTNLLSSVKRTILAKNDKKEGPVCNKNYIARFIKDAVNRNVAEHYAFFYCGHGFGFYTMNETTVNCRMDVSQWAAILGKALLPKKWDIIGFDCCLLSTFEAAVEMNQCASWMIACETYEPHEGMFSPQMASAFTGELLPALPPRTPLPQKPVQKNSFHKFDNKIRLKTTWFCGKMTASFLPTTDASVIGRIIIDTFMEQVNTDLLADPADMALLDLSIVPILLAQLACTTQPYSSDLIFVNPVLEDEAFFCDLYSAFPKSPKIQDLISQLIRYYRQSTRMKSQSNAKNMHGISFCANGYSDNYSSAVYPTLLAARIIPWLGDCTFKT